MARHCETSGGKREGKEEQGNGVGRRKEHHANIPKRTGVGRRKELTLTYRDGPKKTLVSLQVHVASASRPLLQ